MFIGVPFCAVFQNILYPVALDEPPNVKLTPSLLFVVAVREVGLATPTPTLICRCLVPMLVNP